MKKCRKCEETKELSQFAPRKQGSKDGRASWCKECFRQYMNDRNHNNGIHKPMKYVKIEDEWLRDQYENQFRSFAEIAAEVGCCADTVWMKARKNGIKIRSYHEISHPERRIEISDSWLMEQYEQHKKSFPDIAFDAGCSIATVHRRAVEIGINIRTIGESLKGLSLGDRNPNWKGGITFSPYCHKFNQDRKEKIRNEFGRTCFLCGEKENGRKHSIHHVDYNKGQGCGHNWALIPLCNSCHAKTNYNRWYWFALLNNHWAIEWTPIDMW